MQQLYKANNYVNVAFSHKVSLVQERGHLILQHMKGPQCIVSSTFHCNILKRHKPCFGLNFEDNVEVSFNKVTCQMYSRGWIPQIRGSIHLHKCCCYLLGVISNVTVEYFTQQKGVIVRRIKIGNYINVLYNCNIFFCKK